MRLIVNRKWFTSKSIEGELLVDFVHEAFTLEPPERPKGFKPRAIPDGTYEVKWLYSPRHKMFVPHVMNVPDFDQIEIHIGNFPKDTLGCLLVGKTRGEDAVYGSKAEFDSLAPRIKQACDEGLVYITYTSEGRKPVD